jgi:mRNA-degrading endonuclease RelE of RelBE toxin-antitoxin system
MSYSIIVSEPFAKELKHLAKKYPSLKREVAGLVEKLLKEPLLGTPIGNECYKIRLAIASKNKGKSGGARVITHVKIVDEDIYLLSIYDKSEAENISDPDIKRRLGNL